MRIYVFTTEYVDEKFFIYGLDRGSSPYTLCIDKSRFYLYVKTNGKHDSKRSFQDGEIAVIEDLLDSNSIEIVTPIEKVEFYDGQMYTEHKLRYYKVYVNTYKNLEKATKILREAGFRVPEYPKETAKIYSDLNLKPCQWIEFNEYEAVEMDFGNSESRRDPMQFLLSETCVIKDVISDEKPPRSLICTIDFETFASQYKKTGAMPNSMIEGDAMYCVSLVFSWSDSNVPIRVYCICICNDDIEIDGVTVICVPDEESLFRKFSEIIKEEDPCAINGYNTMGYDFQYMSSRCSSLSIPTYGRLKPIESGDFSIRISGDQEYETRRWEGAGGTYHEYTCPLSYGRVIPDTFQMVKRTKPSPGTPGALQSHKLNDVGKYFVNETKQDMPYSETFRIYSEIEECMKGGQLPSSDLLNQYKKVCTYCIQDSVLCMKVFFKIAGWVSIRESSSIFFQDMNKVLTTGQTQKTYTNFLRCAERHGFAFHEIERPQSFKLKGGYVENPIVGKHDNVAVIDFTSMYPTAQMANNICMSTGSKTQPSGCKEGEYTKVSLLVEMDRRELPAEYENFLDNLTEEQFDIARIDDETYTSKFLDTCGIDPFYRESFMDMIREKNGIETKGRYEEMVYYFVNSTKRKGIMPIILEELMAARKAYKKLMKEASDKGDSIAYEMYDQRQQLVKVVMNSIYGCCGAQNGKMKFLEGSASITFLGRQAIHNVQDQLKQFGCKIIYGDTDSVMFQLPGHVNTKLSAGLADGIVEKCKEIVEKINSTLKKPMMIEFEKVMNGVFITKKKYLGEIIWPKKEIIVKGAAAIRGDTAPFSRLLYTKILEMVLADTPREEVDRYYHHQLEKLLNGGVPNEMLSVSKMLSHSYASESAPMNIYSKYLKSVGEIAEAGTKIAMILTKQQCASDKKSNRYRPPSTTDPIDYEYYAEAARKPIDQFIEAAYS